MEQRPEPTEAMFQKTKGEEVACGFRKRESGMAPGKLRNRSVRAIWMPIPSPSRFSASEELLGRMHFLSSGFGRMHLSSSVLRSATPGRVRRACH